MKNMDFTKLLEFDNHEMVSFLSDEKTGLRGFISIHNTNLGPATGGTRYWYYPSYEDALRDAMRLSRAMTYKCALAGVPYGGGKGVIMANPKKKKTSSLMRAYAARVNLLEGSFSTGEDIGITQRDISLMARESRHINGRPGHAGELAPWCAKGIVSALQAALEEVFGSAEINGRSFALKGLGKVGMELCDLLYKERGRIIAADIDPRAIKIARKKFPKIRIVSPADILQQHVDVLSSCALDGDLNSKVIPQLRCAVVCGAANNQLASPEDGERIHRRGILYVPDYLANAGGLINVAGELRKEGYDAGWVDKKIKAIRRTTKNIIELSARNNSPTSGVADRLAEDIFRRSKKRKLAHKAK